MFMHPFSKQLVGKNLSDIKDPDCKHLFVEFVETVKRNGAGFVSYLWPKPGSDRPVPKISSVKGFAPWGWVIGTGISIDYIERIFQREALINGCIFFGVVLSTGVLGWMVIRS